MTRGTPRDPQRTERFLVVEVRGARRPRVRSGVCLMSTPPGGSSSTAGMATLHTVIASTRPTRVGHHVGHWFDGVARQHGKFDVKLVDLLELNLPVFDEPNHPRLHRYEHEHTKRWSATVASADAFVFVTPEYNYGAPPSLLNALTYLHDEWAYKPAAFVSYGGVSGGTRSVQMTKQTLTALRVMPIPEAVSIPFIGKQIEDGRFTGGETHAKGATALLDELHRWSTALATLRAAKA